MLLWYGGPFDDPFDDLLGQLAAELDDADGQ